MAISEFRGEFRFLSNFWPSVVVLDGIEFANVEAAYQAAKSLDIEFRLKVKAAKTPGDAKRLGKSLVLRPDWNDVKLSIMEQLLRQKFQDEILAKQLLATGNEELVEGNTWGDVFWGVCRGVGENNLGKLLMRIRDELQSTS